MAARIGTAFVLVAVVAAVLLWAPLSTFRLLVMLTICGVLAEFYKLEFPRDRFALTTGFVFSFLFAAPLVFFGITPWQLAFFLAAFFVLIVLHMIYYTTVEGAVSRLGLILFGTFYIGATLPAFVWMRETDHGMALIVLTVAVVALGDTFAYVAGKTIGRRKLAPLLSPKKTVEGLIASFFGGVVAAYACSFWLWKELSHTLIIFLGLSLAAMGVVGDLIESLIKRGVHVKDSGRLLPGHGGLLDRLDAHLFAAPFVYFVFLYLGMI